MGNGKLYNKKELWGKKDLETFLADANFLTGLFSVGGLSGIGLNRCIKFLNVKHSSFTDMSLWSYYWRWNWNIAFWVQLKWNLKCMKIIIMKILNMIKQKPLSNLSYLKREYDIVIVCTVPWNSSCLLYMCIAILFKVNVLYARDRKSVV